MSSPGNKTCGAGVARAATCQHGVQQHPHGPDVAGLAVIEAACQDLWRHTLGGPARRLAQRVCVLILAESVANRRASAPCIHAVLPSQSALQQYATRFQSSSPRQQEPWQLPGAHPKSQSFTRGGLAGSVLQGTSRMFSSLMSLLHCTHNQPRDCSSLGLSTQRVSVIPALHLRTSCSPVGYAHLVAVIHSHNYLLEYPPRPLLQHDKTGTCRARRVSTLMRHQLPKTVFHL